MQIEKLYQIYLEHPVISIDTRNIPESSIYFALKGENYDGNNFVLEALSKGASYAVSENKKYSNDKRIIVVENVIECLQKLALFHRNKLAIPIIGITGSNGKTTTKELVAAVLAKKYNVNFTQGNLNNHIGVPLTLLQMTKETEIGVIEMGANHPGEIKILSEIANPDYGIITNIGKAHLEGFGSYEGVIKTKSELYDFLREKTGKCFINADNELLIKQAKGLEQISFGMNTDFFLSGEIADSTNYLVVKILFQKGWLYIKSKIIGAYNFENIMAAACIGKFFGVDDLAIKSAIEDYEPSNNRSQLIKKEKNTIIMDAYNANPTSMMAALENFAKNTSRNKCIILGDMLELGDVSETEHQQIINFIDQNDFDYVFLVGPLFAKTISTKKNEKFEQVELLINYLKTQPIENKLFLIKGSRGIHLEKTLDAIQ